MNRDHYTMDHFDVLLGSNNNAQMVGTHHPHFDHYGSWNYLHGKMHALIDVVQPSTGMSANVDFRHKDECIPCPAGPPPTHLDPIKIFRDENAETVWKLRSDLPYLTKVEISDYRNSFYQNLCLCMLSKGYHRAFSELFHLVAKQEKEREEAGPDSILWSMSPISMQEDKLTLLKDCLSAAEDYYRFDDYHGMYNSYYRLASFFQSFPEDKWLVDHFFRYCWSVSKKITNDNNLKQAEANYHLGLAIELNKEYEEAFEFFHNLYTLSKNQNWKNENNALLFLEACEHLANIRLAMAEIFVDNYKNLEMTQKISFLREAFDFSRESNNKKLEGKCSYKLGVAYQEAEKPDVAINYLTQYYTISKSINDNENFCIACDALAKVFRSQKKYDDCLKYLEEFVYCAEISQQKEALGQALRALGEVYNHLGEFSKATEYFSRSFGISRSMNDSATIDEARILSGLSQGNNLNRTFTEHVQTSNTMAIERLLKWKEYCKEESSGIGKPIPNKEIITLRYRVPDRNIFDHIGAYPKL